MNRPKLGCLTSCDCADPHESRRIVLTGGPGAGKTAVLELVRQSFCSHVKVLQESASVVFGGGFPRGNDTECLRSSQRAIYYIQRELEAIADHHGAAIVLCDRGTLDGLAYWPGPVEDFWSSVGTSLAVELARYDAVIHLRTPAADQGYNHRNPLRLESAATAGEIDTRIVAVWQSHPRRFIVESSGDFLDKAAEALDVLRGELPDCCKKHVIPALSGRSRPDESRSR